MQTTVRPERRTSSRAPRLYAMAALIGGTGAWAFLSPTSFYDIVATYPPFNEHLFHDIGAFLIGLGVALAAAARYRSGLTVALIANAAAATMHAVAHIIDRNDGGRASDPWLLSLVAIAFVVPALKRARKEAS